LEPARDTLARLERVVQPRDDVPLDVVGPGCSARLVGQGSEFGQAFVTFAIVLLPVVLVIGVSTLVRMGTSNYTEALCVVGMNRIRAGYLEMVPDLERFLVTSAYDDQEGLAQTVGTLPGQSRVLHYIAGSPTVVLILDVVIVGALGALIGLQSGLSGPMIILLGIVGFVTAVVGQGWYAARSIGRVRASLVPSFPRQAEP